MINVYKTESVTIKHRTIDAFKNVTISPQTLTARVERTTKWLRTPTGELIPSTMQMYFSPTVTNLSHEDLITIDGTDRKIITIAKKIRFRAVSHWEVWLS